jgi:FKBP-type peptidyl-prolyl cis-trans isomerase 2
VAVAKLGDQVQIHYTGRYPDGSVFDTTEGRDPLQFEAGGKNVIEGVSKGVIGMAEGDARTITVPPEEAYGPHREELIQEVPRSALPEQVSVGDPLRAESNGQEIRVWVRELGEESAVVDANHPLAGKTLEFELTLVAVVGAE